MSNIRLHWVKGKVQFWEGSGNYLIYLFVDTQTGMTLEEKIYLSLYFIMAKRKYSVIITNSLGPVTLFCYNKTSFIAGFQQK